MNEASILLFLVLRNKSINSFLNALKKIFNNRSNNSDIHVTVRGPFRSKVNRDLLIKLKEEMKYDVIKIEGVGMFKNDDLNVVYLKIDSPNLEQTWHKTDYPKSKHGFNPHITLYRGKDEEKAMKIYEFLVCENIRLLCEEFEFVSYDLNQRSLMENGESLDSFVALEVAGNIRPGIMERAERLVGVHHEAE